MHFSEFFHRILWISIAVLIVLRKNVLIKALIKCLPLLKRIAFRFSIFYFSVNFIHFYNKRSRFSEIIPKRLLCGMLFCYGCKSFH